VITPEAALYLEKAVWHLASARTIAAQNIPEIAAREALLRRLPCRPGLYL